FGCGMAAHQGHAVRQPAVRERNVGGGGGAERRRDSGGDAPGDARAGERLDLLAAAPEHVAVAALQARDASAGARVAHEELIDARLLPLIARLLADEHTLGVAPRALED